MNEIIIEKNKLSTYCDDNILITDKKITFKKNGEYTLKYINSSSINLDIEVMDNVIVKLFIWGINEKIIVNNYFKLGENSNLILFKFYYNNIVDEKMIIDLDGEYSKFSYGFSSISKNHEEYNIIVNHNNKFVSSSLSNKCIGLDGSNIKFKIDSVLAKGNTDCIMDQYTKILTLGDVKACIIPNMFIDEDSVIAKHGSVIGGLNEEELFYLMSRGISIDEAYMFLIKGFIFSNLIVDMEKRAVIRDLIQDIEEVKYYE